MTDRNERRPNNIIACILQPVPGTRPHYLGALVRMMFDVPLSFASMVLQLTPRRSKRIADRNEDILVGMIQARIPIDDDVCSTWHCEDDAYHVRISLMMAALWPLNNGANGC